MDLIFFSLDRFNRCDPVAVQTCRADQGGAWADRRAPLGRQADLEKTHVGAGPLVAVASGSADVRTEVSKKSRNKCLETRNLDLDGR
jgi:hypothetical protein